MRANVSLILRAYRVVLGCICAFFGLSSFAAGTCYQWGSTQLNWHETAAAAHNALVTFCNASGANKSSGGCGGTSLCNDPAYNCTISRGALVMGTFPAVTTANLKVKIVRNSDGVVLQDNETPRGLSARANPEGCPECPTSGTQKNLKSNDDLSDGAKVCVNGCEYTYKPSYLRIDIGVSGGFTRVGARGSSTGLACSASTGTAETGNGGTESECGSSEGNMACMQSPPSRCGEVNGDVVCPDRVPDNGCVSYSSGAVACIASGGTGSTSNSPPGPDNGTPGTPAQPDVQISSNGRTVNYYDHTTVTISSGEPATTSPRGGEPVGTGSGSGTCEGEQCGSGGTASGGQTCVAPPTCEGDAIECAILEQEWRTRCVDELTTNELEDILGEGGDIDGDGTSEGTGEGLPGSGAAPTDVSSMFEDEGWLSGRTCPSTYNVNLGSSFGSISYSFADACWFFQAIGYIVLILGAYLSARIVFGAF